MKAGRWTLLLLPVLWLAVLASAVAVIHVRNEARTLFTELERLSAERDELNIEWGQLQLEQSTWATNGRVESVARDELHMVIPQANDLRIVQP